MTVMKGKRLIQIFEIVPGVCMEGRGRGGNVRDAGRGRRGREEEGVQGVQMCYNQNN